MTRTQCTKVNAYNLGTKRWTVVQNRDCIIFLLRECSGLSTLINADQNIKSVPTLSGLKLGVHVAVARIFDLLPTINNDKKGVILPLVLIFLTKLC